MLQLVLGIDAGEHAHLLDDGVELGIVHGAQFGAGHEPRARLEDRQFARDRLGGRRMVAGDHHGADVRPLGGDDGVSGLGARRVDHADQAEQHEIVLDALGQLDLDVALGGRLRIDAERLRPARCGWRWRACAAPAWRALRCACRSSARRSSLSGTALPSSQR